MPRIEAFEAHPYRVANSSPCGFWKATIGAERVRVLARFNMMKSIHAHAERQ